MNRQSISINILRRNQGYNKKKEEQKGTPKSLLRRRRRVRWSKDCQKDDDAEDDARTHAEDDGCAGV